MHLILIGMMGCGKSAVGRLLAQKLGRPFHDSDAVIEQETGTSIARWFATQGEAAFREVEKKVIADLCRRPPAVIATGGGAPAQEDNWRVLAQSGKTIWLQAGARVLLQRLRSEPRDQRPLLSGHDISLENISKILEQRTPFYRKASWTLRTDGLSASEAAEAIARQARSWLSPPRP